MVKNKTKTRRSLKEAMLTEQGMEPQPQSMADFAPVPQKPVSLDQIVDRYIVRYERESIPLEGQGLPQTIDEAADIKKLVAFLLEQAPPPPPPDEEEELDPNDPAAADPNAAAPAPAPDAAADPVGDIGGGGMGGGGDLAADFGGEPGADAAGGGGEPPQGAPPVMNTPAISMPTFCRAMARLLNNFDVLLNPRTIIFNRASEYIKSNYDERTAKYFEQVMKRNYGIHTDEVEYPEETTDFPTPYSGLPGSSGGGAG